MAGKSIVIRVRGDTPVRKKSASIRKYFANFSQTSGSLGVLLARILVIVREETPTIEANSLSVKPSPNSLWMSPLRFKVKTPP